MRPARRWRVLFLSTCALTSALGAAIYWTAYPITCDYDIAGLLMHLDREASVREFLPIGRIIIAPAVAGFAWLTSLVGQYRAIETWRALVCLAAAFIAWVTFFTCHRITRSQVAALVGASVVALSGSMVYLLRVLEDNLLTDLWLCLLVLRLSPAAPCARSTVAFVHAGLLWGIAIVFGLAATSWVLFLGMAAWASGTSWRTRFLRFAIATCIGLAVFLLVVAWLTPPGVAPPVNPLTRMRDAGSYLDMMTTTFPVAVELEYALLGSYYSLFGLPADLGVEWNGAWPTISAGGFGGLALHVLAVAGVAAVIFAAIRSVRADPVRRRFAIACGITIAGLTGANLTSIDGSFPERFDHVPILLAPLVTLALRSNGNHAPTCRLVATALAIGVATTTAIYTVRLGPGTGIREYYEMRAVAAIRRPDEVVIVSGPVGDNYDWDPLSKAMALWLGRKNTWLIATNDIPRAGYYALAPFADLTDPACFRERFRWGLASCATVLLNEHAKQVLEPVLAQNAWALERLDVSGSLYYRAHHR